MAKEEGRQDELGSRSVPQKVHTVKNGPMRYLPFEQDLYYFK